MSRDAKTLALGMVVAASSGCGERCDLDQEVADLAGSDAAYCGWAQDDTEQVAWACAIDAFQNHEAFRVYWTTGWGIDSTFFYVLVSDGEKVWRLAQAADKGRFSSEAIDGWDCVSPYVTLGKADPKGPVNMIDYPSLACERLEPEGNHYQVCGEFEGGDPEPLEFDP